MGRKNGCQQVEVVKTKKNSWLFKIEKVHAEAGAGNLI